MPDLAGQFGLARIGGLVGAEVAFGQRMVRPRSANAARYARQFSHVFVVLDDGTVIEAMPGGARITPLSHYTEGPHAAEVRFSDMQLTDEQQRRIGVAGRAMEYRPYAFPIYPALALHHLGMRPPWVASFIENTGFVICSQGAKLVYLNAGILLRVGGGLSQDVIPIDFADWLDRHPAWIPGTAAE